MCGDRSPKAVVSGWSVDFLHRCKEFMQRVYVLCGGYTDISNYQTYQTAYKICILVYGLDPNFLTVQRILIVFL